MKSVLFLAILLSLSSAFASVSFVSPKDNEVVPTTFKVDFGVEGMTVAKAGVMTPKTGHHHLIIDGKAVPQGQVVPKDATNIHFGDASTSTSLTLKPGKHTLTLQFADGAHKSYGEEFSKTITVEVK
ncbi:MAG: DUF4399 domain-containing protein [Bacteriovorax sp.]|jgi:hypothetical protein